MSGRLSGVDAIGPALERTKKQLFSPFRFSHWGRLAIVCILSGEITGGGGGFTGGSNFHIPTHPHRPGAEIPSLPGMPFHLPLDFLAWALVGTIASVMLVLVVIYISSVFRFILFDAVLNGGCEIGEGWRRRQREGSSFFLWQIGFGLASLATFGIVAGVPILAAWRAGLFSEPDKHIALLIIGGAGVFVLFMLVVFLSALGSLFAKDFVVPIMAMEGTGVLAGWRRVFPMLGAEKGAYSFYVIMKVLLAIGSAILFGIVDFVVILASLIPIGLAGVAIYFFAKAEGLTWSFLTVSGAALGVGTVILLVLLVIAFVSTPAMVFFQSYSMHFFASRYPTLQAAMISAEPPLPAPPVTPSPAPIP